MDNVVKLLKEKNKTISTMESCTGGSIVNSITNISGASEVIKFSAVTYSNEFKIKMGVDTHIIEKYTVYSEECAKEMSKKITMFTNSTFGIGVTGQINKKDENNITNEDNQIYISIYDKDNDVFYNKKITAIKDTREKNKEMITNTVIDMLKDILLNH